MRKAERVTRAGREYALRRFLPEDTERFMCWGSGSANERLAADLLPGGVPAAGEAWTTGGVTTTLQDWLPYPTLAQARVDARTGALAGAALGAIHRLRGGAPGSLDGRHRFGRQSEAFGSRWRHALGLLGPERPALAEELAAWAAPRLAALPDGQEPRLVHGDFGPTNILLDPGGTACVAIDWEHARWGDPYEDLAKIRAARHFPEPNGFGADDGVWAALRRAWAEAAEVPWDCAREAMELYETYYVVCLSVFFDSAPNHRLRALEDLTARL